MLVRVCTLTCDFLYILTPSRYIHCVRHTGNKSSVHTHLNYLVIVSPPFTPSAASAPANVRNLVATRAPDNAHEITKVTVFVRRISWLHIQSDC